MTGDVRLFDSFGSHHKIAPIRHTITDFANLNVVSKRLATARGVRIWPAAQPINFETGYSYNPENTKRTPGYSYQLSVNRSGDAVFVCHTPDVSQRYLIRQYNLHRFKRGGRFLADLVNGESAPSQSGLMFIAGGELKPIESISGGWLFHVAGKLAGKLAIREIKLGGRVRYLFYLVNNRAEGKPSLNKIPVRVPA